MGQIVWYGGVSAPSGWVPCDGRAIAITDSTYSALFSVLGYTYTSSSNQAAQRFQVPDLRGRAPFGTDSSGATGYTMGAGAVGGAVTASVTLSQANMPSHSHTGSGTTGTGKAKFYRNVNRYGTNTAANHQPGWDGALGYTDFVDANYIGADHAHDFSFTTNAAGSGAAFGVPTLPPFVSGLYIIRFN